MNNLIDTWAEECNLYSVFDDDIQRLKDNINEIIDKFEEKYRSDSGFIHVIALDHLKQVLIGENDDE